MEINMKEYDLHYFRGKDLWTWDEILDVISELEHKVEVLEEEKLELKDELNYKIEEFEEYKERKNEEIKEFYNEKSSYEIYGISEREFH